MDTHTQNRIGNGTVRSSLFIILILTLPLKSCDKKKSTGLKKVSNANTTATTNFDTLLIKNDSITIRNKKSLGSIYFKSSAEKSYVLSPTNCIDEESNWGWNVAFSAMNEKERDKAISNLSNKYRDVDFDFVLYESRYDEFFFKIKEENLYLVGYRYTTNNKRSKVEIKQGEFIEKEVKSEKFIKTNILVTKMFTSDFICEYRNNNLKYPFTNSSLEE
ncbi:hypothetical protein SAMN05444377_101181 [Flavobacterium fontis]|uniref:Uncharacterized protein n=1 Tax=Flavobacterium fontis TaxID=1124188 RepID=A0A1M4W5L2_9FLAO|nr:hypothetical protein [Flavobacterium fontis]SHE76541.1 hypothetical protein SAMN05444377_101181 [Flavobacterium fontis]